MPGRLISREKNSFKDKSNYQHDEWNIWGRCHDSETTWGLRHIRSLATWLFVDQFVKANNKGDTKLYITGPLQGNPHVHRKSMMWTGFPCHDAFMNQVMTWCWTRDKPLPEPMINYFPKMYIHHQASWVINKMKNLIGVGILFGYGHLCCEAQAFKQNVMITRTSANLDQSFIRHQLSSIIASLIDWKKRTASKTEAITRMMQGIYELYVLQLTKPILNEEG